MENNFCSTMDKDKFIFKKLVPYYMLYFKIFLMKYLQDISSPPPYLVTRIKKVNNENVIQVFHASCF